MEGKSGQGSATELKQRIEKLQHMSQTIALFIQSQPMVDCSKMSLTAADRDKSKTCRLVETLFRSK